MPRRRRTPRRAASPPRAALDEPSAWRLQHGDFTPRARETGPETGLTILHRCAVDSLGLILARGTITPDMHDAGCMFRPAFRLAALDPSPRPIARLGAAHHRRAPDRSPACRARAHRSSHGRSRRCRQPGRLGRLERGRVRAIDPRVGGPSGHASRRSRRRAGQRARRARPCTMAWYRAAGRQRRDRLRRVSRWTTSARRREGRPRSPPRRRGTPSHDIPRNRVLAARQRPLALVRLGSCSGDPARTHPRAARASLCAGVGRGIARPRLPLPSGTQWSRRVWWCRSGVGRGG